MTTGLQAWLGCVRQTTAYNRGVCSARRCVISVTLTEGTSSSSTRRVTPKFLSGQRDRIVRTRSSAGSAQMSVDAPITQHYPAVPCYGSTSSASRERGCARATLTGANREGVCMEQVTETRSSKGYFRSSPSTAFDQYLQDIQKLPLISEPEEERRLARRAQKGDENSRRATRHGEPPVRHLVREEVPGPRPRPQ